jgi:hypothetical protein
MPSLSVKTKLTNKRQTHSVAMALPFHMEFDTGDHDELFTGRGNHNPEILVFLRKGFHGIFGIGFCFRFTLGIIDRARIQYFLYFPFGNMPAIHPATRMTGKDKTAMTVEGIMGRSYCLSGLHGHPLSCRIVTGHQYENKKNATETGTGQAHVS